MNFWENIQYLQYSFLINFLFSSSLKSSQALRLTAVIMNRAPFSALEHVVRAANIERFNSRQLAAVFVYWHKIDLVLIPIWFLTRGFRYKKLIAQALIWPM